MRKNKNSYRWIEYEKYSLYVNNNCLSDINKWWCEEPIKGYDKRWGCIVNCGEKNV